MFFLPAISIALCMHTAKEQLKIVQFHDAGWCEGVYFPHCHHMRQHIAQPLRVKEVVIPKSGIIIVQ